MPTLALHEDTWQPAKPKVPEGSSIQGRAKERARHLGVFSLGLGLLEVMTPQLVLRIAGLPNRSRLKAVVRLLGFRELATGAVLVRKPSSSAAVWSRVAGDVIDTALLALALSRIRSVKPSGLVTSAALLGVTALDILSAARLSPKHEIKKLGLPIHVRESVVVDRAPYDVYRFWRDFENLPRFMSHLERVTSRNHRSVWRARAPAGTSVEWEAEVLHDKPGDSIAWRSVEGTLVPNRGVVRFKPLRDGVATEVEVELKYEPPGGIWGATIAKLFGEEPSAQIAEDLRRLKQVLETE